jgi:hypothetical protein
MWLKFTHGFQKRGKDGITYLKGQVLDVPQAIAEEAIDKEVAEPCQAPKQQPQQGKK